MPSYVTEATGASGGSPASLDYVTSQAPLLAAGAFPSSGAAISGHQASTIPPVLATTTFTATTQDLYLYAIRLVAGQTLSGAGFVTSTQAAVTPTHWWLALADSSYICRAVTADQTTTAIGASTWFSVAFAASYTATYSGVYYLGVMLEAGTIPTLCAATAPLAAMVTGTSAPSSLPGGTSSTSQSTPATAGTTVFTTPTAATAIPFLFAY